MLIVLIIIEKGLNISLILDDRFYKGKSATLVRCFSTNILKLDVLCSSTMNKYELRRWSHLSGAVVTRGRVLLR